LRYRCSGRNAFQIADDAHDGMRFFSNPRQARLSHDEVYAVFFDGPFHMVENIVALDQFVGQIFIKRSIASAI
jgi:hypothetical protein